MQMSAELNAEQLYVETLSPTRFRLKGKMRFRKENIVLKSPRGAVVN